jgi:thymidylate synthase ThyX
MQVALVNYTGFGHPDPLFAARLLACTKNTRLQMTPDGFDKFLDNDVWPEAKILEEIAYMATTIPSSWEFADVHFVVSGISRATAQQVTRTRTAVFAMQSQRVTDMSDVTWDVPPSATGENERLFNASMEDAIQSYMHALAFGMTLEDARDLLPIGVHCNLHAKYNLRNFVELCQKRDSLRVQGPYVEMVSLMKAEVLRVWPWAAPFFVPKQDAAIRIIEEIALELREGGGAMYKGVSGRLAKAADLLKGG